MTVLFKLVPVPTTRDTVATIECGTDEGGRYYVKVSNPAGLVEERTDWFGFRLDLALLRVAGLVQDDVAYMSPLPTTLAAVAVMAMVGRDAPSGGTGGRRQDAIAGNKTTTMDFPDTSYRQDAEEWRKRGI
jgi:hypothetical protein